MKFLSEGLGVGGTLRELPPNPADIELMRAVVTATQVDSVMQGELLKALSEGHPEQLAALGNLHNRYYLEVQEFEAYQSRRVR